MRLITLLSVCSTLFCASARADTWAIDPGHSQIGFSVKHMMLSNVRGRFTKFSGVAEIDDKDLAHAKVEVEIDASSITTDNDPRDRELRGAEFLNIEKTPKISFKSTRVDKAGRGKLKISGELTIRETTKSVVLELEGPSEVIKDPWGASRRSVIASTKINRKEFGVSWNKTLDNGGLIAGDEVLITIEAELVQQQLQKKP